MASADIEVVVKGKTHIIPIADFPSLGEERTDIPDGAMCFVVENKPHIIKLLRKLDGKKNCSVTVRLHSQPYGYVHEIDYRRFNCDIQYLPENILLMFLTSPIEIYGITYRKVKRINVR